MTVLGQSALRFIPKIKYHTPDWIMLNCGKRRLIITYPNTKAYGLFITDIALSIQIAKIEGAAVYFIRPPQEDQRHGIAFEVKYRINRIMYGLASDEVTILHGYFWIHSLARLMWVWNLSLRKLWSRGILRFIRRALEVSRILRANGGVLDSADSQPKPGVKPYFRRKQLKNRIPIYLLQDQHRSAMELAAQFGITESTRIVVLHSRESGCDVATKFEEHVDGSARRNTQIETYYKAIDFLTEQGYTIVRIGDSTMTPLVRKGVVDTTTLSDHDSKLFEVYSFLRGEFFIGCDSGPWLASYLYNIPLLLLNAAHPVMVYPVRDKDMYALKRAVNIETGELIPLEVQLDRMDMIDIKNQETYSFIDLTEDEVLLSVQEMIENLKSDVPMSSGQFKWREMVCEAAVKFPESTWIQQWGPEDGFIGDGRIVSWFANKYVA